MAERVFVLKLKRVGFENVEIVERNEFALDQASNYPLFGDEVIGMMRDMIPTERHDEIAISVIVKADRP